MIDFNYYLPVNLMFGRGKIKELGNVTSLYGKKALLVTGRNSTKSTGLLDRCLGILESKGIETVVFDKVAQNPLTTTAHEGAALAKEEKCDVVVGLGGGSIMDCAKAIAFLAMNEGDVTDYIYGVKSSDLALPIVLVPTTCGTGSEGNGFAVLTNPENGDKKSLRGSFIISKVSIVDSELMETMPKKIFASVVFDALCHCMEAYVANNAQPITDIMSLHAIELIAKNAAAIYRGEATPKAWDEVTWASTIGGMVIYSAGVTLPHAMEHPASGLRDIVHGKGLAALTPVIIEATAPGFKEKYGNIARLLGGTDAGDCADAVRKFLEEIDLSVKLSEEGILEEDLEWMTENVYKVSGVSIKNHPVQFTKEELYNIYKKAL